MKDSERTKEPQVLTVRTMKKSYGLVPGQYFCKTPKHWEIWQDDGTPAGLKCIKTIPRKSVLWVTEKSKPKKKGKS